MKFHSLHRTPFGPIAATWSDDGLYSIRWNAELDSPTVAEAAPLAAIGADLNPSGQPIEMAVDAAGAAGLDAALEEYFQGNLRALDGVTLDRRGWSPFFDQVYQFCRAIPPGQTLSYGDLAARAGRPRAARAVGQAMATNRLPLLIPCHRVRTARGSLGGYSGAGGIETKRWLLAHEGALAGARFECPAHAEAIA